MQRLDKFFQMSERGTDIKTEFLAGFICFTSNSCQLIIVPLIMHNDGNGLSKNVYLFAFVVSTVVSSVLVGLLSNLPLPAGVGSGACTYFAYALTTRQSDYDLDQKLLRQKFGCTICFVSSLLMIILALSGMQWMVFRRIPNAVKDAMPVGLGLLLALSGFQMMNLVIEGDGMLKTGPWSFSLIMGGLGCVLTSFLHWKGYKTAVLIPLLICTIIAWIAGKGGLDLPLAVESPLPNFDSWIHMWSEFGHIYVDFSTFELARSIMPIISFYLISLFDVGGIVYAVASAAGVVQNKGTEKEFVPGAYGVFVAVGIGSLVAAIFGCSPVIALGDAFIGVTVGGRTGLTAIFTSFFYLLALPLCPIFTAVPQFASGPVLVLIGVELLSLTKYLDLEDPTLALPSFCTIALMPYLYSIDHAILAGLACYVMLKFLKWITCSPEHTQEEEKDKLIEDAQDESRGLTGETMITPHPHEHDIDETGSVASTKSSIMDPTRQGAHVAYEEYYANREGSTLVQKRTKCKVVTNHRDRQSHV